MCSWKMQKNMVRLHEAGKTKGINEAGSPLFGMMVSFVRWGNMEEGQICWVRVMDSFLDILDLRYPQHIQ